MYVLYTHSLFINNGFLNYYTMQIYALGKLANAHARILHTLHNLKTNKKDMLTRHSINFIKSKWK